MKGMMHISSGALGKMWLLERSLYVLVGIVFLALTRKLWHTRQLRTLERLHGCGEISKESEFRYDFLGIAKVIQLASHFRKRTSLAYTNALFTKYGETYASNIIGHRLIFTCNADNTKHLLSTAFVDFDSSPLRKHMFEYITPHGIFTLDGPKWKKSRDQLRSRLSNLRKVVDLDSCEQHFQAFLRRVPPNGQAFDVQSYTFDLSLDMQTQFSLGESVDAQSSSQSDEKKQFVEDLLLLKKRIVQDGFRGPLRHFSPKGHFLQSCRMAREYVTMYATQLVEQQTSKDEKNDGLPLVSDSIARDKEISQSTDQALSILLANDSMSTTLSGLFFCLAQDERVVKKLRESIISTVGSTAPTWGQLGSLHYVRWIIQEGENAHPKPQFAH
jgi:cytochrome P450